MHPEFWQQRWRERDIGFHQSAPTPLLLKHWPALGIAPGTRVFVPLCGKSLDMVWLAGQGHRVLGVELSPIAVTEFFAEHGLTPEIEDTRHGRLFRAGAIEIVCGDAFALDAALLADCAGVFDRAALIALPPALRQRYARALYPQLPQGCRGLLITLEYPQPERDGPPFSVPEPEVQTLYAAHWDIECLERRAIPPTAPGFIAGVSHLETAAYALRRR
jgi:thiopurine S-methyltransferase